MMFSFVKEIEFSNYVYFPILRECFSKKNTYEKDNTNLIMCTRHIFIPNAVYKIYIVKICWKRKSYVSPLQRK